MNKELLIPIKPEHLVNILNGKKILELRTWIPKDYKGWVNIYCTKTGLYELIHHKRVDLDFLGLYDREEYYSLFDRRIQFDRFGEILNGKVVARFWFDEYDIYKYGEISYPYIEDYYFFNEDLESLCLTYEEVREYGKGKTLYAWHIKDLEIFDKPKDLREFYVLYGGEESIYPLKKAPQSYQFVYVKENLK